MLQNSLELRPWVSYAWPNDRVGKQERTARRRALPDFFQLQLLLGQKILPNHTNLATYIYPVVFLAEVIAQIQP